MHGMWQITAGARPQQQHAPPRAIRCTADGTEGRPTLSTTVDNQTVTVCGAAPPVEYGFYLPIIQGHREYYGGR